MAKRHEIPTHLNVDDKAFFGLTVRQTMNLTAGVAGTYGLWNQWPDMPLALRGSLAAFSLALGLVFTLVRVHGRGMDEWAFVLLHYIVTPKTSLWKLRPPSRIESRAADGAWEELSPAVSWEVQP
jgi:hypothetical protein